MSDKPALDFRSTPARTRTDAGFRTFLSGLLSDGDVEHVVQHAARQDTTLVAATVALGFLNEMRAYAAYAEWMGRPLVDLRTDPPSPTAARLLPERIARAHRILPIAHDNRTFTYASAMMFDADIDRDVAFVTGRRTAMVVVTAGQLGSAMGQAYRIGQTIDRVIERITEVREAELVAPAATALAPAVERPSNRRLVAPRPPESRRVLVADDDRMIRLVVRMLLEKEGCTVLEAENGAIAMETARRERPDLMLVDLQMPEMDGFQVVQMMRADAALATIPVMVVTSETSTAVETRVLEMGADDYVMKPFEPEVLISRVRAAFRRISRAA